MRLRIRLDTFRDAADFADITSKLSGKITITDGAGLCVNAKSVLGALHAMEFEEIWCESEEDIWYNIKDFMFD
jgi:phosphotransferase system HPr-like phosphotransfer protein